MRKIVYSMVMILALSLWVKGQQIRLLNPERIQIGPVLEGDTVTVKLLLVNSGKEKVDITKTYAPCKCTILPLQSTSILPGDTLVIPVRIDTEGMWGKTLRTVQIYTSDRANPKIAVLFELNIQAELESEPRFFDLQNIRLGTDTTFSLILTNHTRDTVKIEQAECSDPHFRFLLEDRIIPTGGRATIQIQFHADRPYSNYEIIYIHVQGTRKPLVKIPAYIRVIPQK